MILSIQYTRFLAATLVVLAHTNLQIYGISPQITNMGGFGVDLFFVISGFIMAYVIAGGFKSGDILPRLIAQLVYKSIVN